MSPELPEILPAFFSQATVGPPVFFGIMLGIAMLNGIAWLSTRRALYGLFALFVAISGLSWASLDGLLTGQLLPAASGFAPEISQSLLGAQNVIGSLCQIGFLSLRQRFPWLLHYYLWGGVLPGVLVFLSPWAGDFAVLSSLLFALLLFAPVLSMPAYRLLWREEDVSGRILAIVLPLHFFIMWPAILAHLGLLAFDPLFLHIARISALPIVLALHTGIALQARAAERARDEALHRAMEAQAISNQERLAREEQERFLAMIAHEVRTPVAVIDAAAHSLRLIDEIGESDQAQRESRYQAIRQAVGRMRTLMELAETEERLQAGSMLDNPSPLDLPSLTAEVLACVEPESAARVRVESRLPLPVVLGNTRLLRFALLNLLDNALKYSPPDSEVVISISAADETGVSWCIRNAGQPIQGENARRIFEKYFRCDETSAHPGLGLGLPISLQIVEHHGGRLSLEPAAPGDTTICFCICLPEKP